MYGLIIALHGLLSFLHHSYAQLLRILSQIVACCDSALSHACCMTAIHVDGAHPKTMLGARSFLMQEKLVRHQALIHFHSSSLYTMLPTVCHLHSSFSSRVHTCCLQ